MIAATFLAIFFVPMFFRLVTRGKRAAAIPDGPEDLPRPAPSAAE
jgi:hypothetical protein